MHDPVQGGIATPHFDTQPGCTGHAVIQTAAFRSSTRHFAREAVREAGHQRCIPDTPGAYDIQRCATYTPRRNTELWLFHSTAASERATRRLDYLAACALGWVFSCFFHDEYIVDIALRRGDGSLRPAGAVDEHRRMFKAFKADASRALNSAPLQRLLVAGGFFRGAVQGLKAREAVRGDHQHAIHHEFAPISADAQARPCRHRLMAEAGLSRVPHERNDPFPSPAAKWVHMRTRRTVGTHLRIPRQAVPSFKVVGLMLLSGTRDPRILDGEAILDRVREYKFHLDQTVEHLTDSTPTSRCKSGNLRRPAKSWANAVPARCDDCSTLIKLDIRISTKYTQQGLSLARSRLLVSGRSGASMCV